MEEEAKADIDAAVDQEEAAQEAVEIPIRTTVRLIDIALTLDHGQIKAGAHGSICTIPDWFISVRDTMLLDVWGLEQ